MILAQLTPPTGSELDEISRSIGLGDYVTQGLATIFSGNNRLLAVFLFIAGALLLVYLIMGGFDLMTSAGDPKKMESGKQKITNAFIGFIVVFVAYFIVQIIGLVFGVSKITDIFG